jgi:non-heme chloroperoxidase
LAALRALGIALALGLATSIAPLHAAPVNLIHTHLITSDGVRLHVIEAGKDRPGQPVVLFVPGWSMPAAIWMKQMEALSKTHRVAAIDPRGQGESDVPLNGYNTERRAQDLNELIVQYESVVLVTWSLGSLEALYCLRDWGDAKVAGLVIVDSSVGEQSLQYMMQNPQPPDPPLPKGVRQPTFTEELRQDRVAALDNFMRDIFKTPQPPEALLTLRNTALRMPLGASLSIFPGSRIPRGQWKAAVHGFRKPLLYAVTPQFAGQAMSLKANRPGTQVEVFEKAGHALFVDEPERFTALLADFLARNGFTAPPSTPAN